MQVEIPPHEQRVIDEKKQLDERLTNLRKFFTTDTFKTLEVPDAQLLWEQDFHMSNLSDILAQRISRFEILKDTQK